MHISSLSLLGEGDRVGAADVVEGAAV